ncbi:hypothetical protein STAQ_38630 [Allostella sp. ATCC 35155]|nr:hypothetical protein STAQ_38630 [Stella sp. ATCC 35155]
MSRPEAGPEAWTVILDEPDAGLHVEWRRAPPRRLHGPPLFRTDCNTPVLSEDGRVLAFPAGFRPIGHSLRRTGSVPLRFDPPSDPVRILADPHPEAGLWIESVWRAPDGLLYGWYHRERRGPCAEPLNVYSVGTIRSTDDGRTWSHVGLLVEPRPEEIDCTFDNGWFAGGYGDFCVMPDRSGRYFLLHLTSYHADPDRQGIVVARYPVADRDRPDVALEWWTASGWRRREAGTPLPLIRPVRGWRHRDPDAHWGPAVHWNADIACWVMLLNHTRDGAWNLVQRSIDVAFNRDAGDPSGWTAPRPLVAGGIWYPQAICPDGSEREGKGALRFFVSGFSLWEIRFRPGPAATPARRVEISEDEIAEGFGPRQPDGGFGC